MKLKIIIIFFYTLFFSTKTLAGGGGLPTVNDYSQDFEKSKIFKEKKNLIKNVNKKDEKEKIEEKIIEDELKVLVSKFNLEGNFSISSEEIQELIKDYLNKELTLS